MFSSLPSGGLSQSQAQIAGNSIQSFVGKAEFCYAEAVSVASLYQMLVNNDSVNLVVPGKTSTGPMILNVGHLESQDTSNFLVRGTINNDITSYASLRVVQGALLGSMAYEGENYSITAALPGLSVLHQICHDTTSIGPTCTTVGVDNTGGGSSGSSTPVQHDKDRDVVEGAESSTNNNCFDTDMRILVMFTNAAEATGLDMNQTAQTSVDMLNLVLDYSDLEIRADLAGVVAFPEFVEDNTTNLDRINSDLGSLGAFILEDPLDDPPYDVDQNLTDIIALERNNNAADYVIIFSSDTYGFPIGAAGSVVDTETTLDGNNEQTVTIVSVDFGPPASIGIVTAENAIETNVFYHEMGHLFGGYHEEDEWTNNCGPQPIVSQNNDASGPDYAHGSMAYNCQPSFDDDRMFVTAMFSNFISVDGVIGWRTYNLPAYSRNISANFHPDDIYGSSDEDVARVIEENAEDIACNFTGVCLFSANINAGPPEATDGQSVQLSASSSGCDNGTVVYEWFTSTDGFNFTFAGSGSSLTTTVSFPGNNEDFFVQLFARCDDGDGDPTNDDTDTETFMFFEFDELCPDPNQQCFGGGDSDLDSDRVRGVTEVKVFPNPASDFLQFTFSEEWYITGSSIIYQVRSLSGAIIKSGLLDSWQGSTNRLNVSDISPGMYLINFKSGNRSSTIKFIKQ